MVYRIQIYVDEVEYAGEDIGDDFRFDFVVDGKPTSFSRSISHGSTWDTWTEIFTGTIDADREIPISVTVTEEDILFDDVGTASSTLTIDWRLQRQVRDKVARHSYFVPHGTTSETHCFSVKVVGRGLDEDGLVATLTIKLKAVMGPLANDRNVDVGG